MKLSLFNHSKHLIRAAEDWLRSDPSASGRPVDVLPFPDGSLLVSDDFAGPIYRIRYAPR